MDNNVKCGVIRDLLPLVVDEVATEDSVELVNAHMESCEACRGYYEGMTAVIARTSAPKPEEDKAFIRLGRKMKNQTRIRKWLTRALAGILAFVIIVWGYAFVDQQVSLYNVDMDPDWADVQLYHEVSGAVAARIDMKDGHGWYNCMQIMYVDGIVYLMPMRPEWTFLNKGNTKGENTFLFDIYWEDGKIVEKCIDYDYESYNPETNRWESETKEIVRPVYTIRWGTMENYTTLYIEGDELSSVYEVMSRGSEGPVIMTGVKESDTPDQTIIVKESTNPETAEDAGDDTPVMLGTPEPTVEEQSKTDASLPQSSAAQNPASSSEGARG